MKFLCDRCKTRYSIGDDRVRGKILKIRCKNCANVITVREGMTTEGAAESNRGRPTTGAPIPSATAPAGSALASAFAQQVVKPPPALEEEWYVSIDGDQSGPFSLSDAQRWIAGKAIDADVHCWSEGFDDWLPVDKVSHFRGLRKKPPAPQPPPPLPRVAPGRSGPAMALREEEPKPLFAATMASIEKSAGIKSPVTPANGILAKANGRGSAPVPAIPAAIPAVVHKPASEPNRAGTVPGGHAKSVGSAPARAPVFDASEPAPQTGLSTTVDAPAFDHAITADPRGHGARARVVPQAEPESDGAPELPDDDDDDSLDIGEVSRVVKLADLAKMSTTRGSRTSSAAPVARTTGSIAAVRGGAAGLRTTGSSPKFNPSELGLAAGGSTPGPGFEGALAEPAVSAPVVAQAHRRGLIMLIGVAAALLIGVAILLVIIVQNQSDDTGGGLGPSRTIDTSRPEELVLRQLPTEGSAGPIATHTPIHRPQSLPHPGQGSAEDTGEGKGDRIKSDEIEDMARKQSAGTQRCYMRAQRGAEGIEIADLKKLSVTMTIDKTGTVTDVTLDAHQTETLGQCLIGQIKHWKFRDSPGGMYRIVLAFAS
ncbi:MAG: GYF domain-containing protein [Kofleriaceae bacterium]